MSDLQRDFNTVKRALLAISPLPSEADFALARIRARLTPDREKVAKAICAALSEAGVTNEARRGVCVVAGLEAFDAAIAAMEGKNDHA